MALPNPMYIDQYARHRASQVRVLNYAALEGQEGVLRADHFRVVSGDTPGAFIDAMPGSYGILARHIGGDFEAYVGKLRIAERADVSPTDSSGSRTDLVILRIENPYVEGSGSWPRPPDPVEGPYAHVRVIEGVQANINHVSAYNNTWSAITLARIERPANTGIVDQSHITDLRSLAKLGGERVIIIENPPVDPPPIAYSTFMEVKHTDDATDRINDTDTTFKNWPVEASWQVPIPSWAHAMDYKVTINPYIDNGSTWGELRLTVDGEPTGGAPTVFDINYTTDAIDMPMKPTIYAAATESISSSIRGEVATMRLQGRALGYSSSEAYVSAGRGVQTILELQFKEHPDWD